MFEYHRKKSYSTLWVKQATFTFWVDKSSLKCQKSSVLASFWKPEACSQTLLPDKSSLVGQKMVGNARIKYDVLSDFQTLCLPSTSTTKS